MVFQAIQAVLCSLSYQKEPEVPKTLSTIGALCCLYSVPDAKIIAASNVQHAQKAKSCPSSPNLTTGNWLLDITGTLFFSF